MNSQHIVIYDLFMLIKFILFKMILFSYNPLKLGLWVHFSKNNLFTLDRIWLIDFYMKKRRLSALFDQWYYALGKVTPVCPIYLPARSL